MTLHEDNRTCKGFIKVLPLVILLLL